MHDMIHYILGGFSGAIVGFTLGLVGGGGSILAVPLMVYLVGVKSPHVAIGTSALAVAVQCCNGTFSTTCVPVMSSGGAALFMPPLASSEPSLDQRWAKPLTVKNSCFCSRF